MQRKLTGFLFLMCTFCLVFSVFAQEPPEPTTIMWEDHFEDTDEDSLGLFNIGWIRFSEEDGLLFSVVKQMKDAEGNGFLYMQLGSFQVIGAVVAQTNGLPFVNPLDLPATGELLKANNFSDPNIEITFRFNFFRKTSTFFYLATRQTQNDTTGDPFPVSDPTERPAYTLLLDPINGQVSIAKFPEVSFAGLDPSNTELWTYFTAPAPFTFDEDVWYWAKFYLYEGIIRAKVWEDGEDEPVDWLLDGVDPEPRVTGKFTTLTFLGPPPAEAGTGDIIYIDDIVARGFGETAVEPISNAVPATFELGQNYPNPFNPETTIEFSLTTPGTMTLSVYTLTGQLVRTLVNDNQPAGFYRIAFDGRDDAGRPLPSGVYLYKLKSGDHVATKKMLLMK